MFSGRTTTTISAPAHGPMDLNEAGKPNWRELAPLFALALITVIPIAIGGAIVKFAWPANEYDFDGWHTLGVLLGGLLAFAGGAFFWSLAKTVPYGIRRYYMRIDLWDELAREKYAESNGQLVAQQVSEWAYNPLDLRSLLLGYVAVMATNPAKLTIDELTHNGLWLSIDHRMVKVLTFTQDSAEQFLNLMAEAKVIEGRGPRVAGRVLIAQPREQVLKLLKTAARAPEVQAALAAQEGL